MSSWRKRGGPAPPPQTAIWKCSLGARRRECVELASSGPAEISEEHGACSPRMAHYPALIWAISLFFHTKICRQLCSHVECQGSLCSKKSRLGMVLWREWRVWGGRVRGWRRHRAGEQGLVAGGVWFLPLLPSLSLFISPSISPSLHPSLPHSIWRGKEVEKKMTNSHLKGSIGEAGDAPGVVCSVLGVCRHSVECGCPALGRRLHSTQASGKASQR